MAEKSQEIQQREKLENALTKNQNVWGYSSLGLEAKKAAMSMLSTKHGLYASVPIVCKADNCPYATTCQLLEFNLAPEGELCPLETAQIELRYSAYDKDFDLSDASFTDNVLVNELIETDIMMERCKKLISTEALPIVDVVMSIGEDGSPITQPQVSKTIELNERLSRKRERLLNMMKATRKDQNTGGSDTLSVSDLLAQALEKEKNNEFIIDVKPENLKGGDV